MANPLRERIKKGEKTRALWLEGASPVLAEAACYAGFRFLLIDDEHGPSSIETRTNTVRAITAGGGHAMVRVVANDVGQLKHLLDSGISTVMVPRVETADEARAAVEACRYPPHGSRGFAGEVRAARFGLDTGYADRAEDEVFLMLQIESKRGLENAEAIAAVDGVDMIFPGPYDLSGSLGLRGQTGHPDVLAGVDHIAETARKAGRWLGTVPHGPRTVADLIEDGYDLVIWNSDIGHAINAMRADAEATPSEWL